MFWNTTHILLMKFIPLIHMLSSGEFTGYVAFFHGITTNFSVSEFIDSPLSFIFLRLFVAILITVGAHIVHDLLPVSFKWLPCAGMIISIVCRPIWYLASSNRRRDNVLSNRRRPGPASSNIRPGPASSTGNYVSARRQQWLI
jgi:hypothetical protein